MKEMYLGMLWGTVEVREAEKGKGRSCTSMPRQQFLPVLQGGAHLGEAALCLREVSRVFGASPPAVSASDN